MSINLLSTSKHVIYGISLDGGESVANLQVTLPEVTE